MEQQVHFPNLLTITDAMLQANYESQKVMVKNVNNF